MNNKIKTFWQCETCGNTQTIQTGVPNRTQCINGKYFEMPIWVCSECGWQHVMEFKK